MKNKKRLGGLLLLLLLAAVVTGVFLLAGGNGPGGENAGAIQLSQTGAELGVGGKLYLTAQAKGTVVWSSSDPSVASVRDGEVTGLKEGTAVISATVNGETAQCTVTVSMNAPVLEVSQEYVAVSIGGSYTVKASVTLNGAGYKGAVTYQWVGAGSDALTVTPNEDGSSAVITGVAYGETEYYVTATVNGVALTKRVILVCCNTDITFSAQGQGISPAAGGFDTDIAIGDSVQVTVSVMNKEQPVADPKFTWSVEDETIASVDENGLITALKEGYTVVTCSYGDGNNYVKFFVNSYRPVHIMDTYYVLETAVARLSIKDRLSGKIQGAELDGADVFASANGMSLKLKKELLPSDPDVMGEGRELIVHTDRAQYVYTIGVYSKVITSAAQFKKMASYLVRSEGDNNWAQYNGYIVLGKDIDLEGDSFELFLPKTWGGAGGADNYVNCGFNGIFDGLGHSVRNYTATAGNNALFTTVGKNGIIRNVAFLDVVAGSTTGSIITWLLNGTMEDVYISLKTWENGAVLSHPYRAGRTLKDIVIEYTGEPIEGTRDVVGHWGTPPNYFVHLPENIKSVYIVGNISHVETNCKEHGGRCGFRSYKSLGHLKAAGAGGGFSDAVWSTVGGVPVAKDVYKERKDTDITVSNTETILSAGDTVTLLSNVDYTVWKLEKAPKGVTLKNNVLTVSDKAATGEVTVTASNIFNASKKDSYTFQVVEMSRQSLENLGDLELNAEKGQTVVTLDLAKAAAFTKVEGIKIDGREIPVAGTEGTQVRIATQELKSFLGKQVEFVITCKTADAYNKVTLPATVVSKVLRTAEDVRNMADYMDRSEGDNNYAQYTGYLVLGNDIDLAGEAFDGFVAESWSGAEVGLDMKVNLGFNGTLDGRGYALSGYTATAGHNAMFTAVGQAGLIKNLSITEITAPGAAGNILTRLLNGKLQDVYISLSTWDGGALLAHSYRDGRFMENVVIEYTGEPIDGTRDLVGHWGTPPNYFVHYPSYIQDVYIIGNISDLVTNCAEHGKTECGFHVYKTLAELKAAGNSYDSFSKELWSLDMGFPVPKDIYTQRSSTDITIGNTQTTATFGDTVALEANVPYVSWKLDSAPKGVTLSGSRLTVAENAEKGTVKVTATNLFNPKKTASYSFKVVAMAEQTLDFMGDLELNETAGQTTVTLDLSKADAFSKVEGVKVGETEIPIVSQSGTSVTVSTQELKAFLGQKVEIVATCETAQDYNKVAVPAFILSKVITSADELDQLASFMDDVNGDGSEYQGYIALGQDITCTQQLARQFYYAEPAGTNIGFNGTFNGRGYAIYNMKPDNQGFISSLGEKGIICNVSFLNVDTVGGNKWNLAFCRYTYGKMQDVFITMDDWTQASLFLNGNGNWINMERVVIQAEKSDESHLVFCDALNERNTLLNVQFVGGMSVNFRTEDIKGGDNAFAQHASLADMKKNIAADQLAAYGDSSFWNIQSGLPAPTKLYTLWSSTNVTVTNDTVGGGYEINKGASMELTANIPYVQWELVGSSSGVTLEGAALTVAEDAAAKKVTVKATNLYNDSKAAQITVNIATSRQRTMEPIETLELMPVLGQPYTVIDLGETAEVTYITGVSVNGTALPSDSFVLEDGCLLLNADRLKAGEAADLVITYKTEEANITASCKVKMVVSKIIRTFEDLAVLNSVATPNLDGVFLLGNDIDAGGRNIAAGSSWGSGFRGTFDGQGYSISNLTLGDGASYSGIFGAVSGGTIKNLTFDNVKFAGNRASLFGRVMANLAGTTQKTTVENVTVNITGWNASDEVGVFSFTQIANTKFMDVTVNVAKGLTVANLLGKGLNASNTEGQLVVNLDVGSAITYFNDSSANRPAFVTVNQKIAQQITDEVIFEGATGKLTNAQFSGTAAQVSINGHTETVSVSGGSLSIDLSKFSLAYGELGDVVVECGDDTFTYTNVLYVTQVIDNVAELKAFGAACKAANTTGYYILGADIDCSGEANMAVGNPGWCLNGFSGTFDGRGYTVSNIKLTWDSATGGYGGLFGNVMGATIRNVTFDKVNYASANVALLGRHSIEGGGNNTTIENVTVNISAWAATGEGGVLASRGTRNTIYNGVVIHVADGLTVHNLLGQEWNSNHGTGITVNLGKGSAITNYYWSTNTEDSAAAKAPSIVTVNTAYVPVDEEISALVAAENTATLALTNDAFTGNVTVTVDGNAATATHSGNTVSVDLSGLEMGKHKVVVTTEKGDTYTYTEAWYVTKVIKTFDDLAVLNSVTTPNLDGYYILGGNIDAQGQSVNGGSTPGWANTGFQGTLDGRGFAISNLTLGDGAIYAGIFGNISGGTVKNLTFDNVRFAGNRAGLFGRFMANKAGTTQKTTVENVTVNITGWTSTAEAGVFAYTSSANTNYVDVTVNVADGLTVSSLLGNSVNTGNTEGKLQVNLGIGSAITYYHDSSAVKPAFVSVKQTKPVEQTVKTFLAAENTATLALKHEDFEDGAQVTVSVDGAAAKAATVSGGAVTVDFTGLAMGQHQVVITSGIHVYTYTNVWYVTQIIDDVNELKALGTQCRDTAVTGYYILGSDIDCGGVNMACGYIDSRHAGSFSGTFDGRGKTVSNFKMEWDSATQGYGGFFGNIVGATVKDTAFDAVKLSTNGALLGRLAVKSNDSDVILEKLTVNLASYGSPEALFVGYSMFNTQFNGVTVHVAEGVTVGKLLARNWTSNVVEEEVTDGTGLIVELAKDAAITYYYGDSAVKPDFITVIEPEKPVEATIDTLVAGENTTQVTFQNADFAIGTASVTVNQVTNSVEITEAGKLTLDLAAFGVTDMGQYTAAITVAKGTYTYSNVWYVTQVIDDAAELKALGAKTKTANVDGYYILGGDINCAGEANMASGYNVNTMTTGFTGTFDGRGKTISNITMTWDSATSGLGGLFGKLLGATVQNTVFDNVNLGTNGTLLAGGADKNSSTNANTTLKNLTVNLTGYTTGYGVAVGYSMFNTVGSGLVFHVADGLTVAKLLCRDTCNSIAYISATVNLGTGSSITHYYSTTATKPATFTVNAK